MLLMDHVAPFYRPVHVTATSISLGSLQTEANLELRNHHIKTASALAAEAGNMYTVDVLLERVAAVNSFPVR